MPLFDRRTPEQKAAEEREGQRQQEAKERERQRQKQMEETRNAISAERDRRTKAAEAAIEAFYVAEAPKWEYKVVWRTRGLEAEKASYLVTGDWDADIGTILKRLSDDGWDLVAAWPLSGAAGALHAGNGPTAGGVTNEECWVFKRPKPQLPDKLVKDLHDAQTYGQEQLASLT